MLSAGPATVEASQAGNEEWFAADPVSVTFCVTPAKPVVTITGSIPSFTLTSSNPTGNQWFKDDVIISGATSVNLQVNADGRYAVSTTINTCTSKPSETVIITTALEDSTSEIQLYPNPAEHTLFVDLGSNTGAVTIQLINNIGQVVLNQLAEGNNATLDLQHLAVGFYVARIEIDNTVVFRRILRR
jgi:hypothetical protein